MFYWFQRANKNWVPRLLYKGNEQIHTFSRNLKGAKIAARINVSGHGVGSSHVIGIGEKFLASEAGLDNF